MKTRRLTIQKLLESRQIMVISIATQCGRKKKINAHHIRRCADSANLRFDTLNGITLCWNCHRKITGDELRYEGLFIQIAYENEAK